jgi:hypothetical protein
MHPVGSEYAQLDITGEGFKERSPAMLFNSDRGNGTDTGTTWELLFTEGVYFKTEGGDNEDENPLRINGIQPDGIRDFGWEQTPPPVGHTHTLTAEGNNRIDVSGNTNGTRRRHYHTLTDAIDGSTEEASHTHDGDISMEPDQAVTSAPSTGSTGVGPVIQPVDGYYSYGNWVYGGTGSPPADTSTMEYRVLTTATNGYWEYGEWEGGFPGSPPANTDNWEYAVEFGAVIAHWGEPLGGEIDIGSYAYGRYTTLDGQGVPWITSTVNGYMTSDGYNSDKWSFWRFEVVVLTPHWLVLDSHGNEVGLGSLQHIWVREKLGWYEGSPATYKKRSKTWVPGDNATYEQRTKTWHPPVAGSGSVNAVSRVNTSYTSFSVNTTGISLGWDGSHSHSISIPTSGSSNENGHTHTVSASGIADINVSGSTTGGGAHSHTFDFIYNELKDITNQNTRIASETTVKNRKMRIWRRTA